MLHLRRDLLYFVDGFMSLQGPAFGRAVCGKPSCRLVRSAAPASFFWAMTTLWPNPALAKCHIFSVWHYPKPQRCFTALAPFHAKRQESNDGTPFVLPPERITITLPVLNDINWGEVGPDKLRAIALLRQMMDGPSR